MKTFVEAWPSLALLLPDEVVEFITRNAKVKVTVINPEGVACRVTVRHIVTLMAKRWFNINAIDYNQITEGFVSDVILGAPQHRQGLDAVIACNEVKHAVLRGLADTLTSCINSFMVTEQPVTTAELVSQGYGIRTRFPEAGVHQGYCYTMGFADTFGVELITAFERGGPYTQAIDLAAKLLAKKRLDVGYMYREELANEFGEKLPLDDDIAGVIVHEIDRDDVIERYKPNIHGSHRPKWYMVQVKRSNKRITPTDFKRVYGLRYDPNKKIGVIETPYKNMLTGQLAGVALPEMTYKKYAVAGVVDLLATFMDATRKIY